MKNLLCVTFDIYKEGEIKKNYGVASIISYLKSKNEYGEEFIAEELSIDISDDETKEPEDNICRYNAIIESAFCKNEFTHIAIGSYIWSFGLVNKIIKTIKHARDVKIILGGYEITNTPNEMLKHDFPNADYFIKGYAENSMYLLLKHEQTKVYSEQQKIALLPSVYLTNNLLIDNDVKMVRMETKRGCPFGCKFCEWSGFQKRKIEEFPIERIEAEVQYFNQYSLEKINILDPTFNFGNNYIHVMGILNSIKCVKAIQTRFELINGKKGDEFLKLCKEGNYFLEFGVQTTKKNEMNVIGRQNDMERIGYLMNKLNEMSIPYECHLIYGIPTQTFQSYHDSYRFLESNGCRNIRSFRLRVPKYSEIWEKDEFLKQQNNGRNYFIPEVIRTQSLTKNDIHKIEFWSKTHINKNDTEAIDKFQREYDPYYDYRKKNEELREKSKNFRGFEIFNKNNQMIFKTNKLFIIRINEDYIEDVLQKIQCVNAKDEFERIIKKLGKNARIEEYGMSEFLCSQHMTEQMFIMKKSLIKRYYYYCKSNNDRQSISIDIKERNLKLFVDEIVNKSYTE